MDELPNAVLAPEDARHSQRDRSEVLAPADLRLEPLDLQGVREIRGHTPREALELDGPSVAVVGCGPLSSLLDLTPTPGGWAEGVRESGVFTPAVQVEKSAGNPSRSDPARGGSLQSLGRNPPTRSLDHLPSRVDQSHDRRVDVLPSHKFSRDINPLSIPLCAHLAALVHHGRAERAATPTVRRLRGPQRDPRRTRRSGSCPCGPSRRP
jgi:hypothetical protein